MGHWFMSGWPQTSRIHRRLIKGQPADAAIRYPSPMPKQLNLEREFLSIRRQRYLKKTRWLSAWFGLIILTDIEGQWPVE